MRSDPRQAEPAGREEAVLAALAEIGDSLSALTHEIKNSASGIHIALRALAEGIGEDERAVLEELVGRLRAVELRVRRVMGYATAVPADPQAVRVDELWARALGKSREALGAAGLRVESASTDARVLADPGLIVEALAEILDNAARHVPAGGRVRLQVLPEDRNWLLVVEDDGPGFAAGVDVFDPFVTTRPGAAGVGLATCRRIARACSGSIDAGPGELGGARVELRLPRAPEARPRS